MAKIVPFCGVRGRQTPAKFFITTEIISFNAKRVRKIHTNTTRSKIGVKSPKPHGHPPLRRGGDGSVLPALNQVWVERIGGRWVVIIDLIGEKEGRGDRGLIRVHGVQYRFLDNKFPGRRVRSWGEFNTLFCVWDEWAENNHC